MLHIARQDTSFKQRFIYELISFQFRFISKVVCDDLQRFPVILSQSFLINQHQSEVVVSHYQLKVLGDNLASITNFRMISSFLEYDNSFQSLFTCKIQPLFSKHFSQNYFQFPGSVVFFPSLDIKFNSQLISNVS